MALLIVVAGTTTGGFVIGGGSSERSDYAGPALAVSVTTADGAPVGGLKASNFKVRFLAADQFDPKFILANVAVANEQVAGLYVLGLQPLNAVAPSKGCQKYLYAIAVTSGAKGGDRGQTLTSLETCP